MKRIVLLVVISLLALPTFSQNNYGEAIQQGDNALKAGRYTEAIRKYLAAREFAPNRGKDVLMKINEVCTQIDARQRELAQAKKDLADVQKELSDVKKNLVQEEAKSKSAEKTISSQKQELANCQSQKREPKSGEETSNLEEQISNLEEQILNLKGERFNLEDEVKRLSDELALKGGSVVNPQSLKSRNSYISWGILNVSYLGSKSTSITTTTSEGTSEIKSTGTSTGISTSVYGRYGFKNSSAIGIGGEISFGGAFLSKCNNKNDKTKTTHGYGSVSLSAKFRFYCYQNLFIQSGFGVLGLTYNEKYETAGNIIMKHDYVRISYGVPVQLGYDWIFGEKKLKDGVYGKLGGCVSVKAGIGYNVNNLEATPQIEIAVGLKFGLK